MKDISPVFRSIDFVVTNHRPTDLMSGLNELIKTVYPDKYDLGVLVAKRLIDAMEEEQRTHIFSSISEGRN